MSQDENAEPDPLRDLEPPIAAVPLPAHVDELREIADAQAAYFDAELQPRIDSHIAVYQEAVNTLIAAHRALADETNIELGADTRWRSGR